MSKRKPYHRELSKIWWLKRAFYSRYMIREGSSIFITLYSLTLAWGVFRLSQGEVAFNEWMAALQHPLFITFHLLALPFVLYHSITWFSLAPKLVDIQIKGKKLEAKVIIYAQYITFILASLFCFIII